MCKVCNSTHNGITPELSHLPDPHGPQQGLPDLHLKHLSEKDLRRHASQSTVIDDRSFKVVQQRLEVENQLGWKEGAQDRKSFRFDNNMYLNNYKENTKVVNSLPTYTQVKIKF